MNIDDWLAELKVPREAYRVVMLLPLIYVAWADGKVQGPERAVILRIAREKGLLDDGGAEALERWLSEAPSKAQLKADLKILNELGRSRESIAKDFGADDEQLLLAWCQDVADAAGGLLGLRSARLDSERAALKTIAAALDVGGAKNWRAKLGEQ
jgi:tellurite resistance protein